MIAIITVTLALLAGMVVLLVYSACVVAGRADDAWEARNDSLG